METAHISRSRKRTASQASAQTVSFSSYLQHTAMTSLICAFSTGSSFLTGRANLCSIQSGDEWLGGRWRSLPSPASRTRARRDSLQLIKMKVFTVAGWTPAPPSCRSGLNELTAYIWDSFTPSLSALRSPTHSHLVQLQHHRCVDSSWQWRKSAWWWCVKVGEGEWNPRLLTSNFTLWTFLEKYSNVQTTRVSLHFFILGLGGREVNIWMLAAFGSHTTSIMLRLWGGNPWLIVFHCGF